MILSFGNFFVFNGEYRKIFIKNTINLIGSDSLYDNVVKYNINI